MNQQIPEMFRYEHPQLPRDCKYIVSPSLISKFFDYPRVWYEEVMLGQSTFQGSTATLTGTICHYVYETVSKGEKPLREAIEADLRAYLDIAQIPDVDIDKILADYPAVVNEVVNAYVIPHSSGYGRIELEKQVFAKILDGVYVAGTCDRIEGDCLVDYKTVASKPNDKEIPFNYKIQLLAYTYALRRLGYEINRIRIVYGIKPTKTIGARCLVVTENITYPDEQMMNDTLKLIAETMKFSEENPQYNHLIFKSYALKDK